MEPSLKFQPFDLLASLIAVVRADTVVVFSNAALEDSLKEKYPGVNFVHWSVLGNTHGPDERQILADLPRRLKELKADAVISGMGC